MMKKLFAVVATFCVATGVQAVTYKDGSYTGEAPGKGDSPVVVLVDVVNGKISQIQVMKHADTPMFFDQVVETMVPELVEKNGVEGVEFVSGATMSSKGIQKAVEQALSKAH